MDSPKHSPERYAFTSLEQTTHLNDHAVGDAHEAALKTARPSTPKYSFPKGDRHFIGLTLPRASHDYMRRSLTLRHPLLWPLFCAVNNHEPAPFTFYDEAKSSTIVKSFDSQLRSPSGTKFSHSTRLLEQPSRSSPGPAEYSANDFDAVRSRTPTWGVATGRRGVVDDKYLHTHTGVWGHRKRLMSPVSVTYALLSTR